MNIQKFKMADKEAINVAFSLKKLSEEIIDGKVHCSSWKMEKTSSWLPGPGHQMTEVPSGLFSVCGEFFVKSKQ